MSNIRLRTSRGGGRRSMYFGGTQYVPPPGVELEALHHLPTQYLLAFFLMMGGGGGVSITWYASSTTCHQGWRRSAWLCMGGRWEVLCGGGVWP